MTVTADAVKDRARALGFDLCGVAPAAALPELQFLPEWLARGYAGEMEYMHKSAATRADIRRFLPTARSVIVTGTLYNSDGRREPGVGNRATDAVKIARYARGEDYHLVLAARLQQLADWLAAEAGEPGDAAIFVDKHHVQERVYARHAGLGWIGKNSCLIHPELGSWLFLAGIATSLALDIDMPGLDHCGSCTRCLEACPTGALVDAHVLDANKCISYLTIELAGPMPEALRASVGAHAYGCDICQEACPWNHPGSSTDDPAFQPLPRDGARASELWQRTDQQLHQFVKGSAMTHLPLAGLRRNLAVALGNSGDDELLSALDRPGHGVRNAAHSAETAVVKDAVAWAKAQRGRREV